MSRYIFLFSAFLLLNWLGGLSFRYEPRITLGGSEYRYAAYNEPVDPVVARTVGTIWTLGMVNQVLLGTEGWLYGGATYDPDYNPISDIKGYEPYADRLAHAQSPQQMEWMKSQIDFTISEQERWKSR